MSAMGAEAAAPRGPVVPLVADADLTIIIVSFNDVRWLEPCLRSIAAHAGDLRFEVVVVDNGSDGAYRFLSARFPDVRVIRSSNRGFAHANNRGVLAGTGRYILFLNPDTELLRGSLAALVRDMDARPGVGLVGVRQVLADGALWPTIRNFPGAARALADALGLERWRGRPHWAGERVLAMDSYERETTCDWVSGSFMLARREAVLGAGLFDERFFLYSEEPDLCLRMRRAGFEIRHLPTMTILHHSGKGGTRPAMVAQDAYSRRQYARKHFSPVRRSAYLSALTVHHGLRFMLGARDTRPEASQAARQALRTLVGRAGAPLQPPPPTALSERE